MCERLDALQLRAIAANQKMLQFVMTLSVSGSFPEKDDRSLMTPATTCGKGENHLYAAGDKSTIRIILPDTIRLHSDSLRSW